jgi:hypothetical protein
MANEPNLSFVTAGIVISSQFIFFMLIINLILIFSKKQCLWQRNVVNYLAKLNIYNIYLAAAISQCLTSVLFLKLKIPARSNE